MAAARLIDKRPHNIPGRLKVAELFFDVPLDHSNQNAARIRLFARSARRLSKPTEPVTGEKQLPWFVYLQGGPGMNCRPPQDHGWIGPVLDRGYQVLFLDQRGTGLSTPITASTLARQGDAVKQAEYLRLFRADSIVQDCEAIRKCLTADFPEEKKKWTIIGQSFGGFCAVTYLSKFPEGLKEVFTCGGLPPLVDRPDPVYSVIYDKVLQRNEAYYAKFPEDTERVKRILSYLNKETTVLPSGDVLIPERFQQLGISFGMHGGLDSVHDIVLRSITDLDNFGFLTRPTLSTIESAGGFDTAVLYAILHEPIYCQGTASKWSAERLLSKYSNFRLDSDQVYFTGEMIYPNMFESYSELKAMKETAQIIAEYDDWPKLYDEEQLAKNEVPVYSATYVDDMYVNYKFATDTASKIKNCKPFITNTMYHDGICTKTDELMRQLFTLRDDSLD